MAVFIPPVYFMMKQRWIAFTIHSIIYLFAIIFTLTVVGAVIGIPLWFISATCAMWDLRKQLMEEQATIMAEKMAEKMHNVNIKRNEYTE